MTVPRAGIAATVAILLLVVPAPANAAPGELDRTFNGDGKVVTKAERAAAAFEVALTPNGRIVVMGSSYRADVIARYLPDGRLDRTFSLDGKLAVDLIERSQGSRTGEDVEVGPSGRIVLAAGAYFPQERSVLARFLPDGRVDRSFETKGRVRIDGSVIRDTAIQPDGKVLGIADQKLYRFTAGGNPDPSFGTDGIVDLWAERVRADSIALQSNGKIVLGGWEGSSDSAFNLEVSRYRQDGTIDPSFGRNGKALGFEINCTCTSGIAIGLDDSIVAGMDGPKGAGVVRFTPKGRLDRSFGSDGTLFLKRATFGNIGDQQDAIAVQPNGDVVLAVSRYGPRQLIAYGGFTVLRLTRTGRIDRSFGRDGFGESPFAGQGGAASVIAQTNGKIVAVGSGKRPGLAVVRYLPR